MRVRPTPLDTPPDRQPYFGVRLADGRLCWLRTPSIHKVGKMVQAVGEEQRARLMGMVGMLGNGRSILTLAMAAPDVMELFGALVGVAWADPELELETPAWNRDGLGEYGAAVAEELHEAGWTLQHVALCGMSIVDQIRKSNQIDAEVTAMTAFFLQPKGPGTPSASRSSASPSAPTEVDTSES